MSLIIKGMDMPTSCEDCYLRKAAANYAGWGPFDVCPMIDTDISRERKNNCRCEDCPLVEIPTPHGRLIVKNEEGEEIEVI